jgi:hypothetical protein
VNEAAQRAESVMAEIRYPRSAPLLLACAAAAFAAPGCAKQEESLIVLHAVNWDDGCSFDPSSDQVLDRGFLDLSFTTGYLAPIALLNQLSSNTSNGIEAGEIQLTGVDIELSIPQAPEVIDRVRDRDEALVQFSPPLQTQSIPPGEVIGVFVDVLSPLQTEAIAEALVAEFGGQPVDVSLVAKLSFHGRRTGNSVGGIGDVDARDFQFPISLCSQCLINCSGCEPPMCPVEASDWAGGVCGNAQDRYLYPASCNAPE